MLNASSFLSGMLLALLVFVVWQKRYAVSVKMTRPIKPAIPTHCRCNPDDLHVTHRALEMLDSKSAWTKNNAVHCINGGPVTLFCALALSAKEINGTYNESAAYIQEVLTTILEKFPERYNVYNNESHQCFDLFFVFNNHEMTTYDDVIHLLKAAEVNIKTHLKSQT